MVLVLWAEGVQGAEIYVYVLSMATTLFLGEVYTSRQICSKKARQICLMHSAWDAPHHQPVMRIWKKLGV